LWLQDFDDGGGVYRLRSSMVLFYIGCSETIHMNLT